MTNSSILDEKLKIFRLELESCTRTLYQLILDIRSAELQKNVEQLLHRINEPFMFVVVGEVKAGKSSFINALLETEKDICKVAPDPCTDTVQQIVYGEREEIIQLNPHLKKISLPVEILKEIAVVDTPGVNTVTPEHQTITENFIPASDLIVFVFEAKNPYRQSCWDFFKFIHTEWQKKVIFVLQQADLINENDLKINIEGTRKQAEKLGISSPQIFAVSAKLEREKHLDKSGFKEIRAYIRENITGGKAPQLKLKNSTETAQTILARIRNATNLRAEQLNADITFREIIRKNLDEQEKKSLNEANILTENLVGTFERITLETQQELDNGLSVGSVFSRAVGSLFSSNKESIKQWIARLSSQMSERMEKELNKKINEGVEDIANTIQQMGRIIELQLKQNPQLLKENNEIFGHIAEKRNRIVHELQKEFHQFMMNKENFLSKQFFPEETNFGTDIATGSGLAIIGAALTLLTQGAVFDITGGLITAVGLIFTGTSLVFQRQKIVGQYKSEVLKTKNALASEIHDKLHKYIHQLKKQLDGLFTDFDLMMDTEKLQISQLKSRIELIENQLKDLYGRLP